MFQLDSEGKPIFDEGENPIMNKIVQNDKNESSHT